MWNLEKLQSDSGDITESLQRKRAMAEVKKSTESKWKSIKNLSLHTLNNSVGTME